jgi:hypothetical protein
MGCVNTIKHDIFPRQTPWVGQRVAVCFFYDTEHSVLGKVVRDDDEEPHETIIRLEDGRFIRGIECQFRPLNPSKAGKRSSKVPDISRDMKG